MIFADRLSPLWLSRSHSRSSECRSHRCSDEKVDAASCYGAEELLRWVRAVGLSSPSFSSVWWRSLNECLHVVNMHGAHSFSGHLCIIWFGCDKSFYILGTHLAIYTLPGHFSLLFSKVVPCVRTLQSTMVISCDQLLLCIVEIIGFFQQVPQNRQQFHFFRVPVCKYVFLFVSKAFRFRGCDVPCTWL